MASDLHHSPFTSGKQEWCPLLVEPLRGQALEAAALVAERFRDPVRVLAVAERLTQQTPSHAGGDPLALTFGFYGAAFPCTYFSRCFPEQGWERITHQYLDPGSLPPSILGHPGLFSGISGLAMVMELMSENGKRYRKTLTALYQQFPQKIRDAGWLDKGAEERAESDYDIMQGASGTLAYLLFVPAPDESVQSAINMLLRYLVHLSEDDQHSGRERWYIGPQQIVLEENRRRYPQGYFNCSLSHGIAGPLAALSLAWLSGYRFPGLREALVSLSEWLMQHAISDSWGINWPDVVPLPASHSADEWKQLPPTRAAWCYGAPGIARALWLAGKALDDQQLCRSALDAIECVLQRPIARRDIDAPTLCHGIAGLLALCLRFLHETESQIVREHIPLLVRQILDHYHPDFPLGFRDLERSGRWIDQVGWLTGASGTALVLLAAALPVEPVWDRVLLLS